MLWVFVLSLAVLAYAYVGYPALAWLLARICPRPVKKGRNGGGAAVLMAAHNEAGTLPKKLENLLELARTEPIREIWIGLDGCTDGTANILQERIRNSEFRIQNGTPATANHQPSTTNHQPLVHVLAFETRRGKAAVLNDLMVAATQPIFVMMDARQRVEAGAILKLLENFADPQVGVVSGALVYESAEGGAQKGAESYWGYEKFIRACESRFWAVPGATGALYAIRKELCAPIPENTLVDDVLIPMRAVLKGFRCLFELSARVFDLPTADFGQENLRKRRTLAGIWQIWRLQPEIYSVFANPIWFQWISHKFFRLLTPFLVFFAFAALASMENWRDRALGLAGLAFWGMAGLFIASGLAYWGGRRFHSRLLGLLGAFFGVNWALLQAARDAWIGRFEPKWQKGSGVRN